MISSIRKSFKGNAFKVFIWVMALTAGGLFSLIPLIQGLGGGSDWIAQVNRQYIYKEQFARKVAERTQFLKMVNQQYGQYSQLMLEMMGLSGGPDAQALDMLIDQTLLDQTTEKLKLNVDSAHIQRRLNDMRFVQQEVLDLLPYLISEPSGALTENSLRTYLSSTRQNATTFDEMIERAIKRLMTTSLIQASAHLPTFQLEEQIRTGFGPKKFTILEVPRQGIENQIDKITLTDQDISAYFNSHATSYRIPEKRSGTVWKFSPANYGISISDKEIESYYQKHKEKFQDQPVKLQILRITLPITDVMQTDSIREKAQELYQELKAKPDNFPTVAARYAEENNTSGKGLSDYFAKGQLDEIEIEKAAFALTQNGDIAEPIKTSKGYEIIQRVDRKVPTYKPIAQVQAEIKNALLGQKFTSTFIEDMKTLIGSGKTIAPEVWLAFVNQKKATEETINSTAFSNAQPTKTLFSLQTNQYGFYYDTTQGTAVRTDTIVPSYQPELAFVQKAVERDIRSQKTQELLEKVTFDLYQQALNGISFQELKVASGGRLTSTGFLNRQNKDEIDALVKKGIPALAMLESSQKGQITKEITPQGGFIMKLDDIGDFDSSTSQVSPEQIKTAMAQQIQDAVVRGFIASLHRNATIKVNQSLISQ